MKPATFAFFPCEKLSSTVSLIPSDFTIYANDDMYPIRSFIASTLSQKILMSILENPNTNEYTLNDIGDAAMPIVINYLNGGNVVVSHQNYIDVFKASAQLTAQGLADISMAYMIKNSNPKEIIKFIDYGIDFNIDVNVLVDFVAKSFSGIQDSLNLLSDYGLEMILKSMYLVATPDDVFKVLKDRDSLKDDPANSRLLKFVPGKYIEEFQKTYSNPLYNLNVFRWALIENKNVPSDPSKSNEYYLQGDVMDGIIKAGFTPVVTADSVFSQKYVPQNVLTDENNYYCSSAENGQITFDFSPLKIKLYGYSLRSWRLGQNGTCPRSWNLFTYDDSDPILLDKREEDTSLVGPNAANYFDLKNGSDFSSIFTIEQVESNNPGNKRFVLSGVEFFGEILM